MISDRFKLRRKSGPASLPGRAFAAGFVGLLLGWVGATAGEAPSEKTGLALGSKAPAFTLRDQSGNTVSSEELLKKGAVAVMFHRSADW